MGWRSRSASALTATEPAREADPTTADPAAHASTANATTGDPTTAGPTTADPAAVDPTVQALAASVSTARDSTASDSTSPVSTAEDATASDSTSPVSTADDSTASDSTTPVSTAEDATAEELTAEELTFEDFVRGASTSLHRTAYLLTGSREAAQDAVQTALTRVYLAWDRHGQWDNPTAYARQVVVNTVLTGQRRKWTGEIARSELGERELGSASDRTGEVADRDALRRALDALPLRQRTAVVLRHYLDLSEAQTAAEMGAPIGTIKSLTARGLDALRTQLQEVHP